MELNPPATPWWRVNAIRVSFAVGAAVLLWAALGLWPLAGVEAAYAVLFPLLALVHGLVVAFIVAGALQFASPTDLAPLDRLAGGALVVMLLGLAAAGDRYVYGVGIDRVHLIILGVLIAVVVGFLGWSTYAWYGPADLDVKVERTLGYVASITVGLTSGAVIAVLVVATMAAYRNHKAAGVTLPPVPVVQHITGDYLALGDSYSAGEGLSPFFPGTESLHDGGTGCHRSSSAYSQHLTFAIPVSERFAACSGAITADIEHGFEKRRDDTPVPIPPQIDGAVHPEVGLVTITIGGNDLLFSDVMRVCFEKADCMSTTFRTEPDPDHPGSTYPADAPLRDWAVAGVELVSSRVEVLFQHLRADFPNARVVVIGYPYLLPDRRANFVPDDCASILRRYSREERTTIRATTDQLNDALYERAVEAGIEFVSPVAAWDGHEPCGAKGQYTNSIKPVIGSGIVDGGTFHPNKAGQKELALLLACYLNANATPPNPFADGPSHPLTISGLEPHGQLGLVDPPGSKQAPIACATPSN